MAIDYNSYKNVITNCINEISYTYSIGVVNAGGISKNNWDCNASSIYTSALSKLVNTRYKELEEELKNCLTMLDNMSNIEKLKEESAYYSNQIANKESEIAACKRIIDSIGIPNSAYTANQIQENRGKIKKLENEISVLKNSKAEIDNQISSYKSA